MYSKALSKYRTKILLAIVGTFALGLVVGPGVTLAASLKTLIAKANEEGALNAAVTSSMHGKVTSKLVPVFKKRFGLDIKVTITNIRSTSHYPRAAAATRSGASPTYDTIEGSELSNIQLIEIGGTQRIPQWESLLAEINPMVRSGKVKTAQISPVPFVGHGFKYLSRVKGLVYNPKLISKADLPKTHADLANPKYKGRWTQPPWTSHWEVGPLVFPNIGKKEWLEIVRKAGKNSGAVQSAGKGIQRILIGEYAFGLANTYYALRAKAKDPQAPMEVTYFKDYNQTNSAFYVLRKGAKHPAAGTLFALWIGTPEAKAIWQPTIFATQFIWGESDLDRKVRKLIRTSGAKVIDYLENEKSINFLKWYGTEEGRKYSKKLGRAIRGE